MNKEIKALNEQAEKYAKQLDVVKKEIQKVIVGQEEIIEKVILALIANGHVLIEGVPGLAKTLLIKTSSRNQTQHLTCPIKRPKIP